MGLVTVALKAHAVVAIGSKAGLAIGETITIGGKTFEWNSGTPQAGHIAVAIGATAAACIANLVAAVNANPDTVPILASVDPISPAACRLIAQNPGASGNVAFATTMAAAQNRIVQTMNGVDQVKAASGNYNISGIDVATNSIVIDTGIIPVNGSIGIRDSSGNPRVGVAFSAGVPSNASILTISGTQLQLNLTGLGVLATDKMGWIAIQS